MNVFDIKIVGLHFQWRSPNHPSPAAPQPTAIKVLQWWMADTETNITAAEHLQLSHILDYYLYIIDYRSDSWNHDTTPTITNTKEKQPTGENVK